MASLSTKAEYLALSHSVKQMQCLRHITFSSTHILCLYASARRQRLCNSDSLESHLKHLDVHLNNARQHVARNTSTLHYVSTAHQAADYLTKVMAGPGMKRPNAVLFGSDLEAWNETKEMKKDDGRFLAPLASIVSKQTS